MVKLTRGECLEIDRRRGGLTQEGAARIMGVGLSTYRKWESDKQLARVRVNIGRLKPHELCYIHRRRSGLTLAEVAELSGRSKRTLWTTEQGLTDQVGWLISFWNRRKQVA